MTFNQEGLQSYPEPSQATTALILGILSIVVCAFLGPFAWVMGKNEIAAIDQGRRDPANRSNAQIGKILGIVGTALIGVAVLVIIAILAVTIAGTSISYTFSEIAEPLQ